MKITKLNKGKWIMVLNIVQLNPKLPVESWVFLPKPTHHGHQFRAELWSIPAKVTCLELIQPDVNDSKYPRERGEQVLWSESDIYKLRYQDPASNAAKPSWPSNPERQNTKNKNIMAPKRDWEYLRANAKPKGWSGASDKRGHEKKWCRTWGQVKTLSKGRGRNRCKAQKGEAVWPWIEYQN